MCAEVNVFRISSMLMGHCRIDTHGGVRIHATASILQRGGESML
jgi:hypothetical protein